MNRRPVYLFGDRFVSAKEELLLQLLNERGDLFFAGSGQRDDFGLHRLTGTGVTFFPVDDCFETDTEQLGEIGLIDLHLFANPANSIAVDPVHFGRFRLLIFGGLIDRLAGGQKPNLGFECPDLKVELFNTLLQRFDGFLRLFPGETANFHIENLLKV